MVCRGYEQSVFAVDDFDDYVEYINTEFGNDPRFEILWKIAWNHNSEICEAYCNETCLHDLLQRHSDKGLRFGTNRAQLMKYGNICYASIKNSFVIGSDAKIYKCTVSFDKEENQLGKLNNDGTMKIDEKKLKYWTERKEEMDHELCKKCDVYPTCLGIYCGLNNVDKDGYFLCAGLKNYIDDYLEHISRVDNYVIDLEEN